MHPMLNIAIRAARRAGNTIIRGQQRLDEVRALEQRVELPRAQRVLVHRAQDLDVLHRIEAVASGQAIPHESDESPIHANWSTALVRFRPPGRVGHTGEASAQGWVRSNFMNDRRVLLSL